MEKYDLIIEIILIVLFISIFIFFLPILSTSDNVLAVGLAFGFFIINYVIIFLNQRKYKKNYPFKNKEKNTIGKKISLGLLAGFHFFFFIGSYSHKKYNTQVWYPETTECFFGNISQIIILILYILIEVYFFNIIRYYSIIFLLIPIITNMISLMIRKRRKD